jgi:ribosome-associated protein
VTDPALPAKRTRKAVASKATATSDTPTATPSTPAKRTRKTASPTAAAPKALKAAAAPKAAKTAATKTAATKAAATKAGPATAPKAPKADGLPRRAAVAPKPDREALALARRIAELAEDKKAADIVVLDLAPLTTLADYFVICSGGSERQLDAIADGIVSTLRDEKVRPIGREGAPASHWVLLDFGAVVVHIFTPPERDYYGLEKHWAEAKTILRVQ